MDWPARFVSKQAQKEQWLLLVPAHGPIAPLATQYQKAEKTNRHHEHAGFEHLLAIASRLAGTPKWSLLLGDVRVEEIEFLLEGGVVSAEIPHQGDEIGVIVERTQMRIVFKGAMVRQAGFGAVF